MSIYAHRDTDPYPYQKESDPAGTFESRDRDTVLSGSVKRFYAPERGNNAIHHLSVPMIISSVHKMVSKAWMAFIVSAGVLTSIDVAFRFFLSTKRDDVSNSLMIGLICISSLIFCLVLAGTFAYMRRLMIRFIPAYEEYSYMASVLQSMRFIVPYLFLGLVVLSITDILAGYWLGNTTDFALNMMQGGIPFLVVSYLLPVLPLAFLMGQFGFALPALALDKVTSHQIAYEQFSGVAIKLTLVLALFKGMNAVIQASSVYLLSTAPSFLGVLSMGVAGITSSVCFLYCMASLCWFYRFLGYTHNPDLVKKYL